MANAKTTQKVIKILKDLEDSTNTDTQAFLLDQLPEFFETIHAKDMQEKAAKLVCDYFADHEEKPSVSAGAVLYAWAKYLVTEEALVDETFLPELYRLAFRAYSRFTRSHHPNALAALRRCRDILSVVYGVDPKTAYALGFTSIKQVALHTKRALTSRKQGQGISTLISWRIVGSLRLWTEVSCAHASDAHMGQLVFPITELILGILRAIPSTLLNAPAVLHLVALANMLAKASEYYVPVFAPILMLLDLPDLRKKPKTMSGDRAALADLSHLIALGKKDTQSSMVMDTVVKDSLFLITEAFAAQAHLAAFPELTYGVVPRLRRLAKSMDEKSFTKKYGMQIMSTVSTIDAHTTWVLKQRDEANISPRDAAVADFEAKLKGQAHPLAKAMARAMKARQSEHRVRIESDVVLGSDGEEASDDDDEFAAHTKGKRAKVDQDKAEEEEDMKVKSQKVSFSDDDDEDAVEEPVKKGKHANAGSTGSLLLKPKPKANAEKEPKVRGKATKRKKANAKVDIVEEMRLSDMSD
ncbi:Nucleolar complex protein 2 [Carpediemonas membranifera]|uniref:Nucleolar complex protein 2 n=1 Tax=Carpediemonas membranifera TaxID=201153 RepID=A0A8J6BXN4_9EUKA|nr:Nucleolar complex protein 2 [Carpediemonas membranifera]|eukprot:KAG9393666.1 Nucleolar complex protein 2 [Carpediemonas membranifera]